ncbi:NAD(P)/FAD-dependent oxidoreductase [Corynebacterium sp. 320]|nr:NAD(P)/FAD-dependent oxidoreductase [Corynebacterium sp. 320]KAB1552458.1 NAD(P)/FAD-dependent oxidoreductase [Corynebacterium sp. 321]KAB1554327.1 NAD(P)/FAD-dependent oxidoreductase [Corynebacterium sp. 319]KAB3528579.1 NAD(P)/FAD-dependent oxidoreductase [Corynebacterium sp. 250]KAB3539929.1 NAD(P)/FAD-dependent oxidoreductase [Corynebacterium sp. 366]QNP92125.1 NAD(P)/FAD-dependent oxidoreductase [Corynebacterium zhongnanshanii]
MNCDQLKDTAHRWAMALEELTQKSTISDDDVRALFREDSYWRDLLAFTWNLHTAEGIPAITQMLQATREASALSNIHITEVADEGSDMIGTQVTRVHFTCDSADFHCKGIARLADGKAWTVMTSARELKDFPEPSRHRRPMGAEHGPQKDPKNWADKRAERRRTLGYSEQPYVLIIGGGQGGIALAARLKRQGVPTLVVDKAERPGDQWRSRYHSLCLHDPVWYDHMPYLPFPDDWPVFTPKDKMGDWLEHYVGIMDLDYWTNAECKGATFNEASGTWTVVVNRDGEDVTLEPTQLVLATGMSGVPNRPYMEGQENFRGEIRHSSEHPGGGGDAGKNVIVLGANNSAHDICADLYDHGAKPVMIQRSSTHIVQSDSLMREVFGPLYSEDAVDAGLDVDSADLLFASWPYKILPDAHRPIFDRIQEADKDFYDQLRKAGFLLDFGDDGSGLFLKYVRRGSGYYINVGASELVANGSIPVKSGVTIKEVREHSVVLTDGTELPADVIVQATGYGSMNGWAEMLISKEVADQVGRCWGLGSDTAKDPGPWEGELRNMWKPTQVENLWFHGGNLHQSRHYSRYLALQLKARYEGLDTPVYELAEVHHTG